MALPRSSLFSFFPSFLPFKMFIIYASSVVEAGLGLLLFSKKYAGLAVFRLLIMMIAFLPIHILDVFSDTPAIGSHEAALGRFFLNLN